MKPGKFVIFSLGAERYGLPIASVEQILPSSPITRIPGTQKEVLGVFSLRGETLPVLDTRILLNAPAQECGCFLVASIGGIRAAFVADKVDQIVDFAESQIEANEGYSSGEGRTHTGHLGDRLVVLLEPDCLLPQRMAAAIQASAA